MEENHGPRQLDLAYASETATQKSTPSNRPVPMSHQKQCRVCGTYSTSRWRSEDSVWKFKGYHWTPKKADLSNLVCNHCYGVLKKTGPLLEAAPAAPPTWEELVEAALDERASLLRRVWPYLDDIEQMTAEEHRCERPYDFATRLEAMTMGSDFQEQYERNRRPGNRAP